MSPHHIATLSSINLAWRLRQVLPEGKLPWACKRLTKFSTSRNVAVAPTPASVSSITDKGFTSDAFWDWKLRMKFRKAWHGPKSRSSGLHAVLSSDSLRNTHITMFMNTSCTLNPMTWRVGTSVWCLVFVSFCDGWRGHLATDYMPLYAILIYLCSLSLYSLTHPGDKNSVHSFRVTSLHPWIWLKLYPPTLVFSSGEDVFWVQDIKALHMWFPQTQAQCMGATQDTWHVQYIRSATTWSLQISRRGKICSCLYVGIARVSLEVGRFWSFLISGHTEVWKGSKDHPFFAVLNLEGKHLTSTVETGMLYSFPTTGKWY